MTTGKSYLAIDFGLGGGLAAAGCFDGKRLQLDCLRRFVPESVTMLGTRFWDFPAMLIHVKAAVAACGAARGRELAGIGCDSWGYDFGLLDKTGHLLANPVHHLDRRTVGTVERLGGTVPGRSLYQRTGARADRSDTLHQLYAMTLANSPLLDKAVTMLLMADLVAYFLSGIAVQEYTLATTTGMYEAEGRDWSRDVILSAKIPPVMMPEVVAPGTVIGPLADDVAAECGLGQASVIASGGHSLAGAVAAAPAVGDDWFYIVTGVQDHVGAEIAQPVMNDASFSRGFTNQGGVDGTIRFFKSIAGNRVLAGCVAAWEREDGRPVDREALESLAGTAKPLVRIINPDDPRFLDAADTPATVNAYLAETGQPPAESRGDFVRLCLESLALSRRRAAGQLCDLLGRKCPVVHVVGRDCCMRLLNRFTADALGIVVKAGPAEAEAVGNILMQAMALGDVASLGEAREIVAASFAVETFEPKGAGREWDEAYGRFRSLP